VKRFKFFGFIVLAILIFATSLYYYFEISEKNANEIILFGNIDIRAVDLGFRVFGRLDHMNFEEGDLIHKGDLLATLDKTPYEDELEAAKADIEDKKSVYQNATLVFNRKRNLLKTKVVSQQTFDDAKSAREQALAELHVAKARFSDANTKYKDTELNSPHDGIILTRAREIGSVVQPGETVYVLALDEPIWVRAYINETNLGRIYPGMKAKIYTDSRKTQPYEGQIGFISPVAEFTPKSVETEELRTKLVYRLRILISNRDRYLRQGMPVTVKIETDRNAQ